MKIEVKDNQTILDFALEHYGFADAISEIIGLNPEIENDPAALIREGITPGDFYIDVKLQPGALLEVDENSPLVKKNVVKEIDTDITTYRHGTNN